ncbi:unnamed protein product [Effrenium voratum]|nr:unnamed protein product [Effrenium voratum]
MTSLESLRAALPSHLQERLRLSSSAPIRTGPVLYWMRSCLRGHENPALDAAVAAAGILKTAVVVLVHLEDQYPHATARRQQFLLQGVRSAQEELKTRGFPHVLVQAWLWQVDRRGHRPALHLELAKKCAMVVAEEPFCVPFLKGVEEPGGASVAPGLRVGGAQRFGAQGRLPPRLCLREGHRVSAHQACSPQMGRCEA